MLTQIAAQSGSRTISRKEYEAAQRMVHSFSQEILNRHAPRFCSLPTAIASPNWSPRCRYSAEPPIALVSQLICDTEPFGAMVMCKAIGLDWMVAHAVLNNLPGISEDREEKLGEMGRALRPYVEGNGWSASSTSGKHNRRSSLCRDFEIHCGRFVPKRTRPPAGGASGGRGVDAVFARGDEKRRGSQTQPASSPCPGEGRT